MKAKYAILALATLALMMVPLATDDSSAAVEMDGNIVVNGGFTDMGGGSITVTVFNDAAEETAVTVAVYDVGSGNRMAVSTFNVPAKDGTVNGKVSKDIGFSYGNSGDKYVTVKLFHGTTAEGAPVDEQSGIMIHVSHSIWKDTSTYILIIVAIAAVAIVLYVRSRGNPLAKTKKEEVSFTELNRERRGRKRSTSTDRKRYEGGRKRN